MSSADRTAARRGPRPWLAGAAVVLLAGLSGCATGAGAEAAPVASGPVARAPDVTTRALAEIEFGRQCVIGSKSFVDEAGITADLDERLAAAGFSHEEWRRWHDALVESPELVTQFTEVAAGGCPPV